MKPRNYFVLAAICAILFVAWAIVGAVTPDQIKLHEGNIQGLEPAENEPKFGYGFDFRGTPVAIAIPPGQPDFTVPGWKMVNYKYVTESVVLVTLINPVVPGHFKMLSCENIPLVIALHRCINGEELYWIYHGNEVVVNGTKEEFKELMTNAEDPCSKKGREI